MGINLDVGDLVRLNAIFTDPDGVAIDPTTISLAYKREGGTTTTLVYGTDNALVRDSAGHYHADISLTASGRWRYRWYSTGMGQAAEEGEFYVRVQQVRS